MDKSTLLRRTPAGDAEVRARASGLSVTQRRILTLLDTPRRVRDLSMGPMVSTTRLTRDAARLSRAGLVVYDRATTDALQAANAGTVTVAPQPIIRPLYLLLGIVGGSALVWAGWHFQAAPPASTGARAHAGTASAMTQATPSATPDPPVIATRVLRGDPSKEARAKGTSSLSEAGAAASLPKGSSALPEASAAAPPNVSSPPSEASAPAPAKASSDAGAIPSPSKGLPPFAEGSAATPPTSAKSAQPAPTSTASGPEIEGNDSHVIAPDP